MTTLAERIPLDEITAQAREVRPLRTVLTLVAGLLFGLGWLACKTFAVLWLALTWSWMAVKVGWQSAHGPSRVRQMSDLRAENDELRLRLERLGG